MSGVVISLLVIGTVGAAVSGSVCCVRCTFLDLNYCVANLLQP